jgi:hypothetical protein
MMQAKVFPYGGPRREMRHVSLSVDRSRGTGRSGGFSLLSVVWKTATMQSEQLMTSRGSRSAADWPRSPVRTLGSRCAAGTCSGENVPAAEN